MPPTIKPTVFDPACLDVRRIPAGMVDPVYDEEAGCGFAIRDASNFYRCHRDCPKRGCRQAKFCLADDYCVSPRYDQNVGLAAFQMAVHAINIRERHRIWACAGIYGTDLPIPDPLPTDEELSGPRVVRGRKGR